MFSFRRLVGLHVNTAWRIFLHDPTEVLPLSSFEVILMGRIIFVDLCSDNNIWVVHINGKGKVITTRLLKRDLPVLFQLGQDCLNEFPTSLNFYRYGDHFSFTERSAALRALDTAFFFKYPPKVSTRRLLSSAAIQRVNGGVVRSRLAVNGCARATRRGVIELNCKDYRCVASHAATCYFVL